MMHLFKPILSKFSWDIKATFNHLTTVHNETCGCQIGSTSHEATNRAWNQKKVQFMELQKQSGLDFEDYLNRVLRLVLNNLNSIKDIPPLTEAEFWLNHQTSSFPSASMMGKAAGIIGDAMEEELADINNLIAKDIGAEPNQVFQSSPPPQPNQNHHAYDEANTSSFNGGVNANHKPAVTTVPVGPPSSDLSVESLPRSTRSSSSEDLLVMSNVDELLKIKRKEKHMAPVDSTGISKAFNVMWMCKICVVRHQSKNDCNHYRGLHEPQNFVYNSSQVANGLPSVLIQREDGIYTGISGLKPYTRLGPLVGEVI